MWQNMEGKKRIFADFILNSPFSMEFDFEIDWKNQSLEYMYLDIY